MRLGFLHPVDADRPLPRLAHARRGDRAGSLRLRLRAHGAARDPRAAVVPRVFGSSFSVPPRTEPMPVYRWWNGEPIARVLASERVVLAGPTKRLRASREPPMARLADLLDADESIIAASEEFDQYPGRTGARYWGTVANLDKGVAPHWPIVGAKRVFAYLKPHFRDFEKLLEALRTIDAAVVIHAPGISARWCEAHGGERRLQRRTVRMADVRRECDLGICHAGVGTVETLVTAGKPVLALPQHLEQMMTGKRVAALGAGLVVDPSRVAPPTTARCAASAGRAVFHGGRAGGGRPARRGRPRGAGRAHRRPVRGTVDARRPPGGMAVMDADNFDCLPIARRAARRPDHRAFRSGSQPGRRVAHTELRPSASRTSLRVVFLSMPGDLPSPVNRGG